MALEQKLSLKLAQKLVMTPSLQQAIKLLQMTRMELDGVLTQELVENPILEDGTLEESPADEAAEKAEADESPMSDIDLDAYFSDYAESWEGKGHASVFEERQGPPLENSLSRQEDLYDHLLEQLHMMQTSPEVRDIAELIIGNLDPDGFLTATVEEIQVLALPPELRQMELGEHREVTDGEPASDGYTDDHAEREAAAEEPATVELVASTLAELWQETGEEEDEETAELLDALSDGNAESAKVFPRQLVEEGLKLVRSLDPPGVGYATLRECLLAQLEAQSEHDSQAYHILDELWEPFKRRKFDAIARSLGVPLKSLKPAVELIRSLETRPGRRFNNDQTHYVEPDVYVVKVGDQYVIQLNDDGLPKLRVSKAYRKMLQSMRQNGSESDAQQYIKEKMRSALWLIKSLDQRQRTIYKVADSIVKQQRAFFDYGINHLRAMVLRDVAEDIEMHESTVSRVVSNKYIHTPRGLFPMKYFFHSGIDREYGPDISSLTVKQKIQRLIQEEDSAKPLSDSELMRILKREGIQIARRTVAKYRDELGIPSSTERKRIF